MGKVIWHFTMSLDGFMADDRDSLDWGLRDAGGVPMGMAIVPNLGAIIAGRRTYDVGIRDPDGKPYGGEYVGPIFILSHRPAPTDAPAGLVFADTLPKVLAVARDAAGDRDIAILGASTGRQLLEAGEVDEVLVHVAPILIGSGVPAFALGSPRVREFDVLERSQPSDMSSLRLRPRHVKHEEESS
ncbi:MAG TPA: dihydrofolate reductase family protein [Humibacter sp.]|jgi:dihydrofolate reductase|nr:dihydrofolate reductase family protein [Humibacter sp.]